MKRKLCKFVAFLQKRPQANLDASRKLKNTVTFFALSM